MYRDRLTASFKATDPKTGISLCAKVSEHNPTVTEMWFSEDFKDAIQLWHVMTSDPVDKLLRQHVSNIAHINLDIEFEKRGRGPLIGFKDYREIDRFLIGISTSFDDMEPVKNETA